MRASWALELDRLVWLMRKFRACHPRTSVRTRALCVADSTPRHWVGPQREPSRRAQPTSGDEFARRQKTRGAGVERLREP